VSCRCHEKAGLVHLTASAIHLLIRPLHRFTHLFDHTELIHAFGLRAHVSHGPFDHCIRCNPWAPGLRVWKRWA